MLTSANSKILLSDLEAAVKVAEMGHFTRASEALYRSQTAVTKSVQRLERDLGIRLLDRETRPAKKTKAGEEFAYEIRRGLHFIQRGMEAARRARQQQNSTLHVGHTSYFDLDLLTYLTNIAKDPGAGFRALYHSSSSAEVIRNVVNGVWDCGFVIGSPDTRGVSSILVLRDSLGVIIPSTHRLARKRTLILHDLRDQRLILPAKEGNPKLRVWFLEQCAKAGIIPIIAQESSHPHEARFLAARGIGLAVTVTLASNPLQKGVVYRPLPSDLNVEIRLAFRSGAHSAAFDAFLRVIHKMRERLQHDANRKSRKRKTPEPAKSTGAANTSQIQVA